MLRLSFVLILAMAAQARAQAASQPNPATITRYWALSATPSSQSIDLTSTTTGATGRAKWLWVYPPASGSDVVLNMVSGTASASPANGGNDCQIPSGSGAQTFKGLWKSLSYITTGTTQTVKIIAGY